jgi:hypothetical protein
LERLLLISIRKEGKKFPGSAGAGRITRPILPQGGRLNSPHAAERASFLFRQSRRDESQDNKKGRHLHEKFV